MLNEHLARVVFFFNDTATTEISTLSLHDALPISLQQAGDEGEQPAPRAVRVERGEPHLPVEPRLRSEEHTSELQSQSNLVCRLLLEKKKSADRSSRRTHEPFVRTWRPSRARP